MTVIKIIFLNTSPKSALFHAKKVNGKLAISSVVVVAGGKVHFSSRYGLSKTYRFEILHFYISISTRWILKMTPDSKCIYIYIYIIGEKNIYKHFLDILTSSTQSFFSIFNYRRVMDDSKCPIFPFIFLSRNRARSGPY